MDKFGRYSEQVNEVLAVVKNQEILTKPYQPVDQQIAISTRTIVTLDDIERFRDPDWPDSEIQSEMNWIDIQRIDEALLSSDWSQEFSNITQPAITEIQNWVWKSLHSQLVGIIPDFEIEEVYDFLRHMMYLRGASGRTDSFDEKLFTVYRAGGFPCGWSGSFPNGELVVFSKE